MILQRHKLITDFRHSRKKINRFLNTLSFRALCFLVIGCLVFLEIVLAFSAPPTQWAVSDFLDRPLKPQEIRRMRDTYSIATGQTMEINITTALPTIVKLIPVIFGENRPNFMDPTPHISSESSRHFLTIPPAKSYTVYCLFISNPHDQEVLYEGNIINFGMNLDLLWVPMFLAFFYFMLILGQVGMQFLFRSKDKKKNFDGSFLPSSFSRLKALLELERSESGLLSIVIVPIILWIIIQPLITIRISYFPNPDWINVLRTAERYLISSLGIGLMLIAILILLDTIENIIGKKIRGDIIFALSLPVKRGEWVISTIIWPFYRYGLLFSLIFLIKAFFISLQTKLVFPWLSLISWLLFFLISFLTWISIGVLISLTSKERIGAVLKRILLLFICLVSIHHYGGEGLQVYYAGIIFSLTGLAYSLWYRYLPLYWGGGTPDPVPLIVLGNIVISLPDVEIIFRITLITSIWLIFLIFLIIIVIKKRSVN